MSYKNTPIARGVCLIKQSLALIRENKKFLFFPFVSTLASLLLLSFFVAPIIHLINQPTELAHLSWHQKIIFLTATLGILFLSNVVMIFCNSALTFAILSRFENKPLSLGSAVKKAIIILPRAILWILFNTTIGAFLRLFQTRFNDIKILKTSLRGTAWVVVCYFVVPVLVIERKGPLRAIERSTYLLENTWGNRLVSNIGVGIVFWIARLVASLPLFIGIIIGSTTSILSGSIASFILACFLHLISLTTRNIIRTALYQYATQSLFSTFIDSTLLAKAFRSKNHSTVDVKSLKPDT